MSTFANFTPSGPSLIRSSLITVTTAGAHGFELGDAITIKGLKQDVQGYSRAEGACWSHPFVLLPSPWHQPRRVSRPDNFHN